MSLLRLELLRLTRSWRDAGVLVSFLLFGVLGPVASRYLSELAGSLGHGRIELVVPPVQPVDGIVQYVANAQQLGLIGGLIVALAALNFDAKPDIAIFLRTRVSVRRLLLVRYAVYACVLSSAFALGAFVAWAFTIALIGALPVDAMLAGIGYGAVFFAYAVAMAALAAALSKSLPGSVLIALGLVLSPAALFVLAAVKPWVPLTLGTAAIDILKNGGTYDPLRAVLVAVVASALALLLAVRLIERREI